MDIELPPLDMAMALDLPVAVLGPAQEVAACSMPPRPIAVADLALNSPPGDSLSGSSRQDYLASFDCEASTGLMQVLSIGDDLAPMESEVVVESQENSDLEGTDDSDILQLGIEIVLEKVDKALAGSSNKTKGR